MSRLPWVLVWAWIALTRPDGSALHLRSESVVAVYGPTVCDPRARAELQLSNGLRHCVREEVSDVLGRL